MPTVSVEWVGRTDGRRMCFVWLWSGLPRPIPPRPALLLAVCGWVAAAASASSGGGAGRCSAQPRDLAPSRRRPQPPPLPSACRRPQHGRAGHVGASVTPSLTLTHTRAHAPARCISCFFPGGHTGARESLGANAQGSDPLTHPSTNHLPTAAFSLDSSFAASITATRTRPLSSCCSCPDVEAAGGAGQTH